MNIIYIQDQEIDHYNGHFYHSKSEHFFSRFLAGLKENDTLTVYAGIITRKSAHEWKNIRMYKFSYHLQADTGVSQPQKPSCYQTHDAADSKRCGFLLFA